MDGNDWRLVRSIPKHRLRVAQRARLKTFVKSRRS